MPQAIVIAGPTATGKSELAVSVAEQVTGEVISADSRQVYRAMEVGTAKPDAALLSRVRHHGLDLVDPNERFSAGRFAREAYVWIDDIVARGRVPIVAGGTGFFIRALLDPLAPAPEADEPETERLRSFLAGLSIDELKRWLERLDPERARQLSAEGGAQRLSRSLEVALLSGRPHSWWMSEPPGTEPLDALMFCTSLPREEIYRRTDARLDRMLEQGLIDEVRGLLERYPPTASGFKTLGYAEIVSHLRGRRTLEDAIAEAKRATRQFVRRQLTWFRGQSPTDVIWLDAARPREELASEVVERWREARRSSSRRRSPIASGG